MKKEFREKLYGFQTSHGWSGFVWNFMIRQGEKVYISEEQMDLYLTRYYNAFSSTEEKVTVAVGLNIQATDWTTPDPGDWEDLIIRPGYGRPHYEDEPEPEMVNLPWWEGRLSLLEDNYREEGSHSGRQPIVVEREDLPSTGLMPWMTQTC